MTNKSHFTQAIRDAFDEPQKALRLKFRTMRPEEVFAFLCQQFHLGYQPTTFTPGNDDGPECHALEVADEARRLGIGVLIAEFALRSAAGSHDLWAVPMPDTSYSAQAVKAMAHLLRNWQDAPAAIEAQPVQDARRSLAQALRDMHDADLRQKAIELGETRQRSASARPTARRVIPAPEALTI